MPTPHVPHGWDASVLFEETSRILLCSDLFHQLGDREPVTTGDVVDRFAQAMKTYVLEHTGAVDRPRDSSA